MTTPGAFAMEIGHSIPCKDMQSSAGQLRDVLLARESQSITVIDEDQKSQDIVLAPALSKLLQDILGHIEKGEGVTFVPYSKLLTTQQAADILNVSRPYLIKLLEERVLPFVKTGRHRRIEAKELFDYKRIRDAKRDKALDEIIGIDQEAYRV